MFEKLPFRPLLNIRIVKQLLGWKPGPAMASKQIHRPLVWIDCEMTGLNRKTDTIMSLCCIITDDQLNFVDEQGYEAVVHHDKSVLDRMDEWCTKTHGESGLTMACIQSQTTSQQAADGLLEYIQRYVPVYRSGLLAGNSVHCDKEFLSQEPYDRVMKHLSHRILDVSTIKEAAERWCSSAVLRNVPIKKKLHEARADILESIEEARYYRNAVFIPADTKGSDAG